MANDNDSDSQKNHNHNDHDDDVNVDVAVAGLLHNACRIPIRRLRLNSFAC